MSICRFRLWLQEKLALAECEEAAERLMVVSLIAEGLPLSLWLGVAQGGIVSWGLLTTGTGKPTKSLRRLLSQVFHGWW